MRERDRRTALALKAIDLAPATKFTSVYLLRSGRGDHNAVAHPCFVDIEPGTFNIDRGGGGRDHSPTARHCAGTTCRMCCLLLAIRRGRGVKIVDDAARPIGARAITGMAPGGRARVGGCIPFSSKNLGAWRCGIWYHPCALASGSACALMAAAKDRHDRSGSRLDSVQALRCWSRSCRTSPVGPTSGARMQRPTRRH